MRQIEQALKGAGVNVNENALLMAVSRYLNNGGSIDRLRTLVDMCAERMTGDAAISMAPQGGHSWRAAPGQQKGDGGGQRGVAHKGHPLSASPSSPDRGRKGQPTGAEKPTNIVSSATRTATLKVRQQLVSTIWDRTIGGEVTLRGSTRHHWETMARKATMIGHVARRMLTEIAWPDDVTPLENVATEDQVKAIMNSGYDALEKSHVS